LCNLNLVVAPVLHLYSALFVVMLAVVHLRILRILLIQVLLLYLLFLKYYIA